MSHIGNSNRRQFLKGSAAAGAALVAGPALLRPARAQVPGFVSSDRPSLPQGLQIGDVQADSAIIWSRADREARLMVEWATTPRFHNAVRVAGPHALSVTDYTARVDLQNLPAGENIFVRVSFENLDSSRGASAPVLGQFRTAPRRRRDVRFTWSGDTCGQGWGINRAFGGMKLYKAMQDVEPDFFLHSGDNIYADGVMVPKVTLPDGTVWTNDYLDEVPAKLAVAQTLDQFRGNYLYNLHDETLRAFNAAVPQIWQWDDHETLNNWSPGKDLSADPRYTEKRILTLAARSNRAFLEYSPMRWHGDEESERVYRYLPYGKDLDVFVLDMRSYRAANGPNLQPQPGPDTAYLGRAQLEWLKRGLARSRATWKIIAADMPLGLVVPDGQDAQGRPVFENSSNGDGPVLGREFEIAEVLSFIKRADVRNTVWLTTDVHYCAAHHYDPQQAQFKNFEPFWEFVAGPANAGTFGPNALDNTFGPSVVFQKVPPAGQSNLPPSAGYQFFGQVDIDSRSHDLVVQLKDLNGNSLFTQHLEARPCEGWRDGD
jgi:alkaline phosphatase D